MKKLTLSLTALLLALWPAFAGAETPAFVPLNPAAVNKKLDAAATKLNSGKAGKEEIAAILQEVAGIEDDRQQTRQQYAEELASVQKKLNALGPAPEKDESEPAAIAKQRKEFAGKADGYKAQIAQMDLLAARIDEINILNASFEGMSLAVARLDPAPAFLAIDGNRFRTRLEIPWRCIVKGDGKYADIAAASVLAKTHRDEYMLRIAEEFPQYGWAKNKGYPTREHRLAIREHGLTPHHRLTFNHEIDQLELPF